MAAIDGGTWIMGFAVAGVADGWSTTSHQTYPVQSNDCDGASSFRSARQGVAPAAR